jgi:phospholipid/cholesterol/gamma-HCH transport system substrate-binding protein
VRIGNELKIGITIVVAVLIGFIGFRVMKDVPIFRQGNILNAVYDRVDGLSVGTPVIISGIKVGSVQQMLLQRNDSVRVVLNINMLDGVPVGSIAYIRAVDILGSKAIVIERGASASFIPHDGQIKGVFDEGLMGEITESGGEIAANITQSTEKINSLLEQMEILIRDGGRENISSTLENLNSTSTQIDQLVSETNADIKASVSSLKSMLENLDELTSEERGDLQRMIKNLESTSVEFEEMSKTLKDVTTDLADIMQKINNGEGTLGKLVNDPSLYNNLDSMTVGINKFLHDFNDNPRHFLRHLRLIDVF